MRVEVVRAGQVQSGWTTVGTASPLTALSDDSDATYIVSVPADRDAAISTDIAGRLTEDEGVHQVRYRFRYRADGSPNNDVLDINNARLMFVVTDEEQGLPNPVRPVTSQTPITHTTSWTLCQRPFEPVAAPDDYRIFFVVRYGPEFGVAPAELRLLEIWGDIEFRNRPVLDDYITETADGPAVTAVTLTNRPWVNYTHDLDGLAFASYEIAVLRPIAPDVDETVFFQSGLEPPPGTAQSDSGVRLNTLPDGDYRLEMKVVSTIGQNVSFLSNPDPVLFSVAFVAPNPPTLTVTEIVDPPAVELVMGVAPGGTPWDDTTELVGEIERLDPCQYDGWRPIHAEPIDAVTRRWNMSTGSCRCPIRRSRAATSPTVSVACRIGSAGGVTLPVSSSLPTGPNRLRSPLIIRRRVTDGSAPPTSI